MRWNNIDKNNSRSMTNESQLQIYLLDANVDTDLLNIKYQPKKLLKDNSLISKVNFVFDLQNNFNRKNS